MSQARAPVTWQQLQESDQPAEPDVKADVKENISKRLLECLRPNRPSAFMDAQRLRYGFIFALTLILAVTFALSGMVQMFYSLVSYQLSENTQRARVTVGVLVIPTAYLLMMGLVHELTIMVFDAVDVPPLRRFRVMIMAMGVPRFAANVLIVAALDAGPVIAGIYMAVSRGAGPYVGLRELYNGYQNCACFLAFLCSIVFLLLHRYLSLSATTDQMRRMNDALAAKYEAPTPATPETVGAAEGLQVQEEVRDHIRMWMANREDASPKKAAACLGVAYTLLLVLGLSYGFGPLPLIWLLAGLAVSMILMVCGVGYIWPRGTNCTGLVMTTLFVLITVGILVFAFNLSKEPQAGAMDMDNTTNTSSQPFFDLPLPPNLTFKAQPVTYYPICGMRWGSSDVASELSLSATDLALFSQAVYSKDDAVSQVLDPLFVGTPLGRPKLEKLANNSVVGRWGIWLFPEAKLRIFAVRGTHIPLEIFADADIWGPIAVMQMFSYFMPVLKILPRRTSQWFVNLWSNPFGLFEDVEVWDPIIEAAEEAKKKSDEEGVTLVLTGHSLGAALAMATAARTGVQSVVFSPPGLRFTMGKMSVRGRQIRKTSAAVAPIWDVVPWVDEQNGFTQYIECNMAPLACHGIGRTACELHTRCGDAFGRTSSCNPGYQQS